MIQLTHIRFHDRINYEQLPLFRGAVIAHYKNNSLFHNHKENNYIYSYPLIQYKSMNGYAGIIGINEGGEALEEFSNMESFSCRLGEQLYNMKVQSVISEKFDIRITDIPIYYKICSWLPLNQNNYREFMKMQILSERINMLEKILVGNILSFAKGVDVYIDSPIVCRLMSIDSQCPTYYKNVGMMSFNVTFQSNILLPEGIGIGKGASINRGNIYLINKK